MTQQPDTRSRLIDAAFELFARNGFHAVGLDRILAEVGVSKQTFYNHFESKDALLLEVLRARDRWETNSFVELMRRFGGPTPGGRLAAVFDALDAWFNEPQFRGCIFISAAAEFPAQNDPAHVLAAEHKRSFQGLLRDLAAEAGFDEPARLAAELSTLVDGAIVQRHVANDRSAAEVANRIGRLVLARHARGAGPEGDDAGLLDPAAATQGATGPITVDA